MVRYRRLGALALIGIAIIGLLYFLEHAQTETNEPTGSSSAPNSPGQRKSASKSAGRPPSRPVKSKVGCVNYEKFTAKLSFDPSIVVPPDTVFRSLKRLVFFIGHARSGSSMLGRLLDAHPHMTISHEFDVFSRWLSEPSLQDKTVLFKSLYTASFNLKWRVTEALKVYDQSRLCHMMFNIVPGQWQGTCDGHLEVIGDKKAAKTAWDLELHPEIVYEMKSKLQLPMLFIYPIRHPLDMIATQILRDTEEYQFRHTGKVFNHTTLLESFVQHFQNRVANIQHWMESKWLDILTIYNDDLISDPPSTLRKICAFLQITCTAEYIGNCTKLIYNSPSRTRDHVYWPSHLKQSLLNTVKRHSFLARYQHDF